MIEYQFFPRSVALDTRMGQIVECFRKVEQKIESPKNKLVSDQVLALLKPHFEAIGLKVEAGKKRRDKIQVPVLFGLNNRIDKSFDADAVSEDGKVVIEVEAGRAVKNYQFLKDIFQACMMSGVEFLVLGVRRQYQGMENFKQVNVFLETLYISNRVHLPLKGILLIGY